jgi:hypothetical protein
MPFFDQEARMPEIYGAILKLPAGRLIGIWCSARGRGTVKLDETGRLRDWPPPQQHKEDVV